MPRHSSGSPAAHACRSGLVVSAPRRRGYGRRRRTARPAGRGRRLRGVTMPPPRVVVVGAGLTGCTLAHRLARDGVATTLLERAPVPGGLIRSEHLEGVLYEPHG